MSRPTEPAAPDSLPNYIAEGLPKQDREALEEFIEYAETLIDYRHQLDERPIQEKDLSGDVEVIEESLKGTVYKEYRTCGDESCHCMSGGEKHGPYRYRAYWEEALSKKSILGKRSRTRPFGSCDATTWYVP